MKKFSFSALKNKLESIKYSAVVSLNSEQMSLIKEGGGSCGGRAGQQTNCGSRGPR